MVKDAFDRMEELFLFASWHQLIGAIKASNRVQKRIEKKKDN